MCRCMNGGFPAQDDSSMDEATRLIRELNDGKSDLNEEQLIEKLSVMGIKDSPNLYLLSRLAKTEKLKAFLSVSSIFYEQNGRSKELVKAL